MDCAERHFGQAFKRWDLVKKHMGFFGAYVLIGHALLNVEPRLGDVSAENNRGSVTDDFPNLKHCLDKLILLSCRVKA